MSVSKAGARANDAGGGVWDYLVPNEPRVKHSWSMMATGLLQSCIITNPSKNKQEQLQLLQPASAGPIIIRMLHNPTMKRSTTIVELH